MLERAAVSWVSFPIFADNEWTPLAKKYLPEGPGAVFTFGLRGGYEAGGEVEQPQTGLPIGPEGYIYSDSCCYSVILVDLWRGFTFGKQARNWPLPTGCPRNCPQRIGRHSHENRLSHYHRKWTSEWGQVIRFQRPLGPGNRGLSFPDIARLVFSGRGGPGREVGPLDWAHANVLKRLPVLPQIDASYACVLSSIGTTLMTTIPVFCSVST